MRKIRAGIVKKLEGAKLTNSELSIFLYCANIKPILAQYQVYTIKIFVLRWIYHIRLFIRGCISCVTVA